MANTVQPYQTRDFSPEMTCEYSARDVWNDIRAVTLIDCGPVVGMVAACQKCADFYAKLKDRQ